MGGNDNIFFIDIEYRFQRQVHGYCVYDYDRNIVFSGIKLLCHSPRLMWDILAVSKL